MNKASVKQEFSKVGQAKNDPDGDDPYDINGGDKMIVGGMTTRHKYFNIAFIGIPKMAIAFALAVVGGIFTDGSLAARPQR